MRQEHGEEGPGDLKGEGEETETLREKTLKFWGRCLRFRINVRISRSVIKFKLHSLP